MTDYQQLSATLHKDLKVKPNYKGLPLFRENTFPVLACELETLQREYPVVFLKSPKSGKLSLHLITGLDEGQNAFISNGVWLADAVPLYVELHPFYLSTIQGNQASISLSPEHPCFANEAGIPLFTQDGLPSEFLQKIQKQLSLAYQSQKETDRLISFIETYDLYRDLKVNFIDHKGEAQSRQGMLIPDTAKLLSLDKNIIIEALEQGHYRSMVLIEASMRSMDGLIYKSVSGAQQVS